MPVALEVKKQKREELVNLAKEVQSRAENEKRSLNADENKLIESYLDQAETLAADIRASERIEAAQRAISSGARASAPGEVGSAESASKSPVPIVSFRSRAKALRAFRPRAGQTQFECEERAYNFGQWARATLLRSEAAARYCRDHAIQLRTAQSEGVNSAGGFLVPDQFEQTIIDNKDEYGVARRYAHVIPMSRDTMDVARRTSGLTAYGVGENEAGTASTKAWDRVSLTAKKWLVLTQFSTELAEDAIISMADDLAMEIAHAFANKEDDTLFNGDGTSTYQGMRGIRSILIDGSHAGSYVTAPGSANTMDTWAEVTDAALTSMMSKLPGWAMRTGNAKWYCPRGATWGIFGRLLRAASGNDVNTMAGAVPPMYAGFPIVPVDAWTDTEATDNSQKIIVLFGDMDLTAILGDRRGTTISTSSERYFEYDQIGILGSTRFDINAYNLGDSSTAGAMIGLYGN